MKDLFTISKDINGIQSTHIDHSPKHKELDPSSFHGKSKATISQSQDQIDVYTFLIVKEKSFIKLVSHNKAQ
jgi:hypothetical protein